MPLSNKIDQLFNNKHLVCKVLLLWLLLVVVLFVVLANSGTQFFTLGPSPNTLLLGIVIDTWGKWLTVSFLTFSNTIITEYVYECLQPWILTTVCDHKSVCIPYSKRVMLYICVVSSSYRTIMQVVMMYIMLAHVDFLLVRFVADIAITILTSQHFLRDKVHDAEGFRRAGLPLPGTQAEGSDLVADSITGGLQARGSLDALLPT